MFSLLLFTFSSLSFLSDHLPSHFPSRKKESHRDHCMLHPHLIPTAMETEWARQPERQTVGKRREVFRGRDNLCSLYSISSSVNKLSLPFSVLSLMERHPLSLSFSLSLSPKLTLTHHHIFSPHPPSLPLSFHPCFWYSRHAAFSRWSNSFAAATSRPLSPRQPSISYWCANKSRGREWGEVGAGCEVEQVEGGVGVAGEAPDWESNEQANIWIWIIVVSLFLYCLWNESFTDKNMWKVHPHHVKTSFQNISRL